MSMTSSDVSDNETSPDKHKVEVQTSRSEPAFSVFNQSERWVLIVTLSLIGMWSTVSSPIYFPAIPTVSRTFHVSESLTNISVVAYLVFQGVAPAFCTSLADYYGIRPVLVVSVLLFSCICIGISQTNVFWLLVVLRCFQAAAIGPVIAIAAGASGDVCTRENRGSFIGFVSGFQLVGNSIGPIIGAALISSYNTWRSIFVFLAIGGGATAIYAFIFLPETSRQIVGNGSVKPQRIINRAPSMLIPRFAQKFTNETSTISPKHDFSLFRSFVIFSKLDNLVVLAPSGLTFACWTVSLTTMSSLLESPPYNYTVLHVGIVYIPQGAVTLVTSLLTGRLLNWYYKRKLEQAVERSQTMDLSETEFNVVHSRLDMCIVPVATNFIGTMIFGWCMNYHKHISSIYISTCLLSFSSATMISCTSTILVDLYPQNGPSSTSCLNLMRCLLAALFVGVLDIMEQKMTVGGMFTFLASITLISSLGMYYRFYFMDSATKESKSDDL